MRERARALAELPELNVLLFAVLLNLPWEFWQIPFFGGMADAPHWKGVLVCTKATAGDALIALICFWCVSLLWRDRGWVARATTLQMCIFIGTGLVITTTLEWLSVRLFARWSYSGLMPQIGGIGLLPLLQWLLIPLALIWVLQRQLR